MFTDIASDTMIFLFTNEKTGKRSFPVFSSA